MRSSTLRMEQAKGMKNFEHTDRISSQKNVEEERSWIFFI